jgi:peptidoglycan/xylan/chitin deacetylase (PgdA/CDA1 family)
MFRCDCQKIPEKHIELKATINIKRTICIVSIVTSFMAGCITKSDMGYPQQPTSKKSAEFMLSFDDGPLPETTERVLNMLATLKAMDGVAVKAGFFLVADAPDEFWRQRYYYAPYELWTGKGSIARHPAIARRIKQAGHIIGNHTAHHAWFRWPWLDTPEAVLAEFTEWEAISEPVLGSLKMRLFRPPYFILNKNVRETANQLGYRIVMGESVGDAIPGMTVEGIKKKTRSILAAWSKPYPCLLIFHENRPTTYRDLDEIILNLQQQGFQLVHFDPERLQKFP